MLQTPLRTPGPVVRFVDGWIPDEDLPLKAAGEKGLKVRLWSLARYSSFRFQESLGCCRVCWGVFLSSSSGSAEPDHDDTTTIFAFGVRPVINTVQPSATFRNLSQSPAKAFSKHGLQVGSSKPSLQSAWDVRMSVSISDTLWTCRSVPQLHSRSRPRPSPSIATPLMPTRQSTTSGRRSLHSAYNTGRRGKEIVWRNFVFGSYPMEISWRCSRTTALRSRPRLIRAPAQTWEDEGICGEKRGNAVFETITVWDEVGLSSSRQGTRSPVDRRECGA